MEKYLFRNFQLVRNKQVVAIGTVFKEDKIAMCWLGETSSLVFYTSLSDLQKIHCHPNTVVKFIENWIPPEHQYKN